jgi:uncharacterized membrane-anchored protein YjiN (DUF445 family)
MAEYKIDIAEAVTKVIQEEIEKAIDEVAIKRTVREYIQSAISKDEVKQKVDFIIDSYVRSAVSQDITKYTLDKIDAYIENKIEHEVDKAIRGSYLPNRVKDAVIRVVDKELEINYDIGLTVNRKANTNEQ